MFEKFNLIQYSLTHDGKKLTDYILTDITTRARVKTSKDTLLTYRVEPYETPEDVSQKIYGTPYYHWVIMMLNEIYDQHSEWYMGDDQLYAYCDAKYNKHHIILPENISVANNTFYEPNCNLVPNDIVLLESDDMPGGLYANTPYYVFNKTDTTFQLTTTLSGTTPVDITSVGTAPVYISSYVADYLAYWIDDQNNIMSTALDLYEGWSNNEDTLLTYKNKMHDIIYNQPSRRSYISATSKDIVDLGNDVIEVTEQTTPADQVIQRNYRAITNFEYESMLNEKRRDIYVLKPEYIKSFIDQFNAVVQK